MTIERSCSECGARWEQVGTCDENFHQILLWEWEDPRNAEVHHLMVLSYHLQHPHLYSPDGLVVSMGLLREFVEHNATTEEIRRRYSAEVDSGQRKFKIAGTPTSHGSYDPPVQWTMTCMDVIERGISDYRESVRAWARSILETLKVGGHYQAQL